MLEQVLQAADLRLTECNSFAKITNSCRKDMSLGFRHGHRGAQNSSKAIKLISISGSVLDLLATERDINTEMLGPVPPQSSCTSNPLLIQISKCLSLIWRESKVLRASASLGSCQSDLSNHT